MLLQKNDQQHCEDLVDMQPMPLLPLLEFSLVFLQQNGSVYWSPFTASKLLNMFISTGARL
ncbi:hypothetical protein T4A_12838 [Trichinella pseudospiralis]|uniref:Uncharacterized protein n=1 Tax=Trichinella pseudospiralis TaxID=6337 RepID=A0A0V1EWW1_TRIPS|nr:hypothetical protein T4A_12838 [Trichinella pseudospiralis]